MLKLLIISNLLKTSFLHVNDIKKRIKKKKQIKEAVFVLLFVDCASFNSKVNADLDCKNKNKM